MKANLDWDNSELSIKYGQKIVTIPIICIKKQKVLEAEDSDSEKDSDEFEEEEI